MVYTYGENIFSGDTCLDRVKRTIYVLERLVMSRSVSLSREDCLSPLHNVLLQHFHESSPGRAVVQMVKISQAATRTIGTYYTNLGLCTREIE